ncbi:MAG: hypothetical protein M3153_05255 [Chloroflexota bacterium]|nr:hypothetical protein [Chloroflexota bacterium]
MSLDGEGERRDFLDEAWRWSDTLRPPDAGSDDGPPVQAGVSGGWRSGRVPGSTIDDAWRAGEIRNPYVDRNSLAAEWVPQVRLDGARPVGWPERTGAAYFETNVITLLPGEERAVGVDWHDVPATDRRLRLSGWNVEERELARG